MGINPSRGGGTWGWTPVEPLEPRRFLSAAYHVVGIGRCDFPSRVIGIDDAGQVVGWYSLNGSSRNFVWSLSEGWRDAGAHKEPEAHFSVVASDANRPNPRLVNEDGLGVAGDTTFRDGLPIQTFARPPGYNSELVVSADINEHGVFVGYTRRWDRRASGSRTPFVSQDGTLRDLNELIAPDSGWRLHGATGINDGGWIVGNGSYNEESRGFLLIPVTAGDVTPPAEAPCAAPPASTPDSEDFDEDGEPSATGADGEDSDEGEEGNADESNYSEEDSDTTDGIDDGRDDTDGVWEEEPESNDLLDTEEGDPLA